MKQTYDVAVIGAGLAGLRASIAAAESGAQTVLVSKAAPPDTTTALAWGAASGAVGGTTPEQYLATLEKYAAGAGLPALRRVLADDTAFRLGELERFGVEAIGGHGHVRVEGPFSRPAENLVKPLFDRVRAAGVKVILGSAVVGLGFAEDGSAAGLALRDEAGQRRVLGAGAVVLAGGGFAGLFPRNDSQGGNLGDCMALGLLAGGRVVDMEFITFTPPGLAEPGLRMDSVYARPLLAEGKAMTVDGHPFDLGEAEAHFREKAAKVARDDGRYDFLCDLSGLTEVDWADEALLAARRTFLGDRSLEAPLRVSPLAHYTYGGIAIDEQAATGVAGLYAAGECTGGIFGGGRPGGGALADCIVFGARAGEAAAAYAEGLSADEGRIERLRELRPLDPALSQAVAAEAGWALWNYCALYRHAAGLRAGLDWVDVLSRIASRLPKAAPGAAATDPGSSDGAVGLLVARAAIEGALAREETRGAHHRLDHPDPDPDLEGKVIGFDLEDLDPEGAAVVERTTTQ